MKTLLVMPEFQTHTKYYKGNKWHFPFSIWYLGTYWRRKGEEIDLVDLNLPQSKMRYDYDKIGISCITAQVPRTLELLRDIKRTTNAKTVLGGIHPTLFPRQTSRNDLVDSVCLGQAAPFDQCTPLDYSLLDEEMMSQPKNFLGLVTSRGCPYKCTFCINSILKSDYEYWDAETIAFEVERGLNMGFKGMFFWDDNFFANRKRVFKFIDIVKQRQLHFEWFALTRVNHVDDKLLKACYDIGLRRANVGAESGSNRILKYLNKGITVEQTERCASLFNKNNIESSYSYMIGLPDETPEDILLTVKHQQRMSKILDLPKLVGPMLFCPYPGSTLYNECLEAGWKQPQEFIEWNNATTGVSESPYKMPWVKHKDMVNIYWSYSLLIPLSYKKLIKLYRTYLKRTRRGLFWQLAIIPILVVATMGKLRHRLRYYRFGFETKLFKQYRGVLGA